MSTPRLKRWSYIFGLSLASYAIVFFISKLKWVNELFQSWSEIITSLGLFEQILIYVLCGIGLVYFLKELKVIHFSHHKAISEQFLYPPVYFAAIISTICFFLIGPLDIPKDIKIGFIIGAIWLIFCVITEIHYKSLHPKTVKKAIPHPTGRKAPKWLEDSKNQDLIDLYKWIHSETPIRDDEDDKFDRKIYAERIANQINKRDTAPHHIALIGRFGSGKSSVCKTVEGNLQKIATDLIFIYIDGWGRSEKSCAAQILEELIDKLSEYVDCSAIRNLPKSYLDALSGASFAGSQSIVGLLNLNTYENPTTILKKINIILESIDKRVIIFLEDFDRNTNSENTTTELASLLDRLRDLTKINFVLSIGPEVRSDVLSRISTYREDLSDIDCESYLKSFFNLAVMYETNKNSFSFNEDHTLINTVSILLNKTIKVPRDFKNILRRVYISWEELAGEVDLYDLVALNTIRFTEPAAFEYISKNILIFKGTIGKKNDVLQHEFSAKFKTSEGILPLVSFLFPSFDSGASISTSYLTNQRISYNGHTDYFKRSLDEKIFKNSDVIAFKKFKEIGNETSNNIQGESELINEISRSQFLLEKIRQFYRYRENDTPIFDVINIYRIFYSYIKYKFLTDTYISDDDSEIKFFCEIINYHFNDACVYEVYRYLFTKNLYSALLVHQKLRKSSSTLPFFNTFFYSISTPAKFIASLSTAKNDEFYILFNLTDDMVILKELASRIVHAFEANPNILAHYVSKSLTIMKSYNLQEISKAESHLREPWLTYEDKLKTIYDNVSKEDKSDCVMTWKKLSRNSFRKVANSV